MMNYPLLIPRILERADTLFPHKEIITREGEGLHRYTYRDLTERGVGDYKYEEFLIDYRLALLNRFALIARTFVALSRGTPDEEPKPAGLFGPFQALAEPYRERRRANDVS